MKNSGILIVVSGFSGAGKGTLMKRLLEKYDTYSLSISMTTREPRQGETHGKEYFFVTKEQFEQKISESGFVEHAVYCKHYYGTPRDYVENELKNGKDVILEIEIQGALKIKEKFPDALLLFVMPPSIDDLRRRLIGRGTETKEVIEQRLQRAIEEAEDIEAYEYIVINDDLEICVDEMHQMILASHNAPTRNLKFIENMRNDLIDLSKGE